MSETKRLGRGLEALLGPVSREQAEASGALRELPVAQRAAQPVSAAHPNRRGGARRAGRVDRGVGPAAAGRRAAPGRRVRADRRRAPLARGASGSGWTKIPAVVKDVDDQTLLTLALIENLQRDDLSPIDEAAGYQRLGESSSCRTARSRGWSGGTASTVANLLRLLQLPDEVQATGARAASSPKAMRARSSALAEPERDDRARAARPWTQGWSVREMEARVPGETAPGAGRQGGPPARAPRDQAATADVKRVEDALRKRLGTDVRVTARRRGRGLPHAQLLLQRRSRPPARADPRQPVRRDDRAARAASRSSSSGTATTRSQTYPASASGRCGLGVGFGRRLRVAGARGCWPCSTVRSSGPPRGCPAWSGRWRGSSRTTPRCASCRAALDSVESRYAQVRQMIGGDIVRDPLARSLHSPAGATPSAPGGRRPAPPGGRALDSPALAARRGRLHHPRPGRHGGPGRGPPGHRHRRRRSGASSGRPAAGRCTRLGEDPEYGFFVLLDHPDDYQTMYGHLSRILVTAGRVGRAGPGHRPVAATAGGRPRRICTSRSARRASRSIRGPWSRREADGHLQQSGAGRSRATSSGGARPTRSRSRSSPAT